MASDTKRSLKLKPVAVMPRLRHVVRSSISDDIVNQLLTLISRGELKPGQRLPSERELCIKFGTGRSSLREALRCLCIIGVLRARVGEGTSVALQGGKFFSRLIEWKVISEQQDMLEMMELRVALEGVTAANAARRLTPDDLKHLRQLLSKMKATLKDSDQFANLDLEFHLAIAKASGNMLVFNLVSMIRTQLERAITKVLDLPDARPLSLAEHAKVLHAIEQGDSDAARQAIHTHLNSAIERYRSMQPRSAQPRTTQAKSGAASSRTKKLFNG